jgi:hypothetical protein
LAQNGRFIRVAKIYVTEKGTERRRSSGWFSPNKNPGPEGPALIHPGGVIWVINFISSVQVSGVRCQQLKSTRWVEVAHEVDFPSSVLGFNCNSISVQDSGFRIRFLLTPEA